ncbi:MAG: hypothetical protein DRH70_08220, partial [Candidatus Coatesbacteria bacterium]
MDENGNGSSGAGSKSNYTDKEIDYLISCEKRVKKPPRKKMRNVQGSLRNEMTVESVEGGRLFRIFMRQNIDFNESFSIGLVFCQVTVARRYGLYALMAFMCMQNS